MPKAKHLVFGIVGLAIFGAPFAPMISIGCSCIDAKLLFSQRVGGWPYSQEPSASREGFLKVVPVGAKREAVERLMLDLRDPSYGNLPPEKGRLTRECAPSADGSRLSCDYNDSISMFALVQKGFNLEFQFDGNSQLRDLAVQKYLKVLGLRL